MLRRISTSSKAQVDIKDHTRLEQCLVGIPPVRRYIFMYHGVQDRPYLGAEDFVKPLLRSCVEVIRSTNGPFFGDFICKRWSGIQLGDENLMDIGTDGVWVGLLWQSPGSIEVENWQSHCGEVCAVKKQERPSVWLDSGPKSSLN